MNKIFSPYRFFNLLRNDLLLNHKRYLYTLLGLTVVLYLMLLYTMNNTYSEYRINNYQSIFAFACIAGVVFIAGSFPELNDKIKTADYLLLPASAFEKFLAQFLVRVVFFISFFLFIFWFDANLARWTMSMTEKVQEGKILITRFSYSEMLILNGADKIDRSFVIAMIFSFITCIFSLRLFFGRYAAVKMSVTILTLIFAFVCLMVLMSHIFFGAETEGFSFYIYDYRTVFYEKINTQLFAYIIAFITWAFMLPIGYFKLKEKQV